MAYGKGSELKVLQMNIWQDFRFCPFSCEKNNPGALAVTPGLLQE